MNCGWEGWGWGNSGNQPTADRILWEGPEEGANLSSRRVRPAGRPIGRERQKDGGAGEGRKLDEGVS